MGLKPPETPMLAGSAPLKVGVKRELDEMV